MTLLDLSCHLLSLLIASALALLCLWAMKRQ
jgi:hypothetical protein